MISVLSVDNRSQPDTRKLFIERSSDFRVEFIDSPLHALDLLGSSHFDIIVSEYDLLGMNGLEFLHAVRARFGEVPFILYTGGDREDGVIQVLNDGADYYLRKGGDPGEEFAALSQQIIQAVQRRKRDEELRESERRYREVVETQSEYISRFTPDYTIILVNEAYCRHFKKSREDIIGHRFFPDVFEEDKEVINRHFASFHPGNPVLEIEYRNRMPDGSTRWHRWRDQAFFDETGRIVEYQSVGRDITNWKETEPVYEKIFGNVGVPLVILDEDMTIARINAECEKAIGYSRSETEGILKWPSLIAEEDRERMMEYHTRRRINPADVPGRYEFRFVHKSGEIRDASLTVTIIPGTMKSLVSFRNISDLKETQTELEKTEKLMSQLLSQLPDYVILHEGETIIYVNREGARLMGKTPKEITGSSVLSFASPEYHELLKTNIALRYQGVDLKPYPIEVTLPTGERRWLEVRSATLPEQEKNTTLSVLTDITDRRNAEEALKESESRYRTIIENMQDLVYQADLSGRLIMMSPAGIKLTGYSPEELIGHDIGTNFYSDPYERKQFLELLRTDGKVTNYPLSLVDKNGDIHYVTASSQYFTDIHGNVAGVEGILHDITDKKRAEDAVLLANRKLSLLTNITRHDINNQLGALMGYLSILNESLQDSPAYEYSQKAESIAERINAIIQFTKEYEEIGVKAPIWQLIRQVVHDAYIQAHLGPVILKNDIPEGIEVFADPLLIKIIYNLIDNAVRYGNTIRVIRFFIEKQGGELVLIGEDDGMGIGIDEKEKIFEKGYGKNTGLGLALCREILSMTDILITETGEYRKGARFEIRIPSNGWRE